MEDNTTRFTVRLDSTLLRKFYYIAAYEDRSGNSEMIRLIKKRIQEFEQTVGPIPDDLD